MQYKNNHIKHEIQVHERETSADIRGTYRDYYCRSNPNSSYSTLPSTHCCHNYGIGIAINRDLSKYTGYLHCVPKKTCDYIFYNNFNNKCPITIIFGIVSSKSYVSLKGGFISHLTYLVQLPYLGKSQNSKNDQFRRKQHIVL